MPAGVLGVIYILRGETCRSTATQNTEQSVRPQAVPTTRLPTAFYFFNSRQEMHAACIRASQSRDGFF